MSNLARDMRVVALIDMDCFYVQVEQREKPELWGKPVAVVQYNQYQGGVIIAVSYEARAFGVKRDGMRGDKGKKLCPDLVLCPVAVSRFAEKADLSKYRNASEEVFDVLCNFDERILVERASVDEAYLDLTAFVDAKERFPNFTNKLLTSLEMFETTHVATGKDVGDESYDRKKNLEEWLVKDCKDDRQQLRLAIGAAVVEEIRQKIHEKTQFHCSAGIASNKIIAKLVCSRHKPRQQTVIAPRFIATLFETTPISQIRGLGGQLGEKIAKRYGVKTMAELGKVDRHDLAEHFPHAVDFIELILQGIDEEPVRPRDKQLSIGVSRNFLGKSALSTVEDVKSWLRQLVNALCDRLESDQSKNKRTAQSLTCGCTQGDQSVHTSPLFSYDNETVFSTAWSILRTFNKSASDKWDPPITNIHISAHRFRNGVDKPTKCITSWLKTTKTPKSRKEGKSIQSPERISTAVMSDESDLDRSFIFCDSEEDDLEVPSTSTSPKKVERSGEEEKTRLRKRSASDGKDEESVNDVIVLPDGTGKEKATKMLSNCLPPSLDEISESVLDSLPPEIREEILDHYRSVESRKQSKRVARMPVPEDKKLTKRRKGATSKSSDSRTSKKKKISDFFPK